MKFVFDLDGTLTRQETLPLIAGHFGLEEDIAALTQSTILGHVPFVESFIQRVNILGKQSVSDINDILGSVELFDDVCEFIAEHKDDCYIATGNLDVWIEKLGARFPCTVFSSKGSVMNDKVERLTDVLQKIDIVKNLQADGHTVVYIGDGNNDANAMRQADFSIAVGLVHFPALSVMDVADFAIFDETALLRLLNAMANPEPVNTCDTVVLSCAGVGSRLGLNTTKALMEMLGRPFIHWHLDIFEAVEDLRVVIGFQANDVIKTVIEQRSDVIFVLNHSYFSTGTGKSLYLGARFSAAHVIAWDGDLVVHHADLNKCLTADYEYVGISAAVTDDAVFVSLDADQQHVTRFDRTQVSEFEWSGPARLHRDKIRNVNGHVFEGILPDLPIALLRVEAFDIDTESDYSYAKEHFTNFTNGQSQD